MEVQETTLQLTTIPPGKIKCYITGKLRKDTPEEHVRQRVARSLVEEYGYQKKDIELERKIYLGSQKKRADIVIFEQTKPHEHEHISVIVEAKRETVKPNHTDQGIGQLQAYLAATPNAKFGMWVGSEVRCYAREISKGKVVTLDAVDIPLASGAATSPTTFASLVPATDGLKEVFRRCHHYIAANQGGSKEAAFHEFLKVTFCKVFDERVSAAPRFYITSAEQRTPQGHKAVAERVQQLFKEVCDHYGYIFGDSDKIHLKPNIVAYLTAELQKYTLLDTDFDYKGQAYEEIVGANSRGERGEFFTPRNLCKLAVDMVFSIVGTKSLSTTRVIDPACGTGGFLRSYVHSFYQQLLTKEQKKWGETPAAAEKARQALKAFCDLNVFGIDFNPVLVRAAQMNLVMHGDGSSNIFHENSLLAWGEWADKTRGKVTDNSFDVVITNPPFGEDLIVDDPHVLAQYSLSAYGYRGRRNEMAPQELFMERCHRLLKPNGIAAVVTPDNILSNPSYRYMRQWLLMHFELIASVWLPGEMFQPSTGTQTSLLILRKRPKPIGDFKLLYKEADSDVFLAVARFIGHDQRGTLIPLRDDEGDIVMREVILSRYTLDADGDWAKESYKVEEQVARDDLPGIATEFRDWLAARMS